jgi:hypothetical protein
LVELDALSNLGFCDKEGLDSRRRGLELHMFAIEVDEEEGDILGDEGMIMHIAAADESHYSPSMHHHRPSKDH